MIQSSGPCWKNDGFGSSKLFGLDAGSQRYRLGLSMLRVDACRQSGRSLVVVASKSSSPSYLRGVAGFKSDGYHDRRVYSV